MEIRRAFELGSDDNLTAVVIGWSAAEDKARDGQGGSTINDQAPHGSGKLGSCE